MILQSHTRVYVDKKITHEKTKLLSYHSRYKARTRFSASENNRHINLTWQQKRLTLQNNRDDARYQTRT